MAPPFTVSLVALIALAVAPAVASADECLISSVGMGEVSGISVEDPLVAVFGSESVDVALEIRLGLRQLPGDGPTDSLAGDDSDNGVLVCFGPTGAECSPVDGPTEAPSLADPMPASQSPDLPLVAASAASEKTFAVTRRVGPSGTATRVERPPRS